MVFAGAVHIRTIQATYRVGSCDVDSDNAVQVRQLIGPQHRPNAHLLCAYQKPPFAIMQGEGRSK